MPLPKPSPTTTAVVGQAGYAATKAFVRAYTEALRAELAGSGVTVATLNPGPVRTEFLQSAGMDEKAFADALPKFMWMPSPEVAQVGIDALEHDRGDVIAGLPSRLSTRLFQLIPHRLLLPLLAKQHPALRR
jgi:short-subunit dehydrogenase